MSFPQRLLVFLIGALIGGLLSFYILKRRALERPAPPPQTIEEAELEAVPAILKAYEERRQPLQSRFIIDEFTELPNDNGETRRVIILEGRLLGQLLRIEEWQRHDTPNQPEVSRWRISAANRARIYLSPNTPPSEVRELLTSQNTRLLRRTDEPDCYVISLNESNAQNIDLLQQKLKDPQGRIIKVTPDYLDNL